VRDGVFDHQEMRELRHEAGDTSYFDTKAFQQNYRDVATEGPPANQHRATSP
jgi:hypothetical protein